MGGKPLNDNNIFTLGEVNKPSCHPKGELSEEAGPNQAHSEENVFFLKKSDEDAPGEDCNAEVKMKMDGIEDKLKEMESKLDKLEVMEVKLDKLEGMMAKLLQVVA